MNEFEKRNESRLSDYKNFLQFQFHDFIAGSELTVFEPKNLPKVTFGGMNQAFSYGYTRVLMKTFSNFGSNCGVLGLSGLRHRERVR